MQKLIQMLAKHIKSMLTGKDNQTVDVGRVCLVLLVLAFIGLAVAALARGDKWDPQAYGIAGGALLGGGGAGLGMKAKTEPDPAADGGAS